MEHAKPASKLVTHESASVTISRPRSTVLQVAGKHASAFRRANQPFREQPSSANRIHVIRLLSLLPLRTQLENIAFAFWCLFALS